MAQRNEVLCGKVATADIVHQNSVRLQLFIFAIEKNNGNPAHFEHAQQLRLQGPGRLHQHDPVNTIGEKELEIDLFLVPVVGVSENDRITRGLGFVLHAAHDLREEEVRDVRYEYAERKSLLLRQSARHEIGPIVQLADSRFDARTQLGTYVRTVVNNRRDGSNRNGSPLGDIIDRCHTASTCTANR